MFVADFDITVVAFVIAFAIIAVTFVIVVAVVGVAVVAVAGGTVVDSHVVIVYCSCSCC